MTSSNNRRRLIRGFLALALLTTFSVAAGIVESAVRGLALAEAQMAAGYPDAWFHDLRRFAVRNFERAGISRSVAMMLSGHETEAVYRRYAIADSVALEEGVAKLAGLSHGTNTAQLRHISPIDGRAGTL